MTEQQIMNTFLHINPATGVLSPGRFFPTTHCDDRPANMLIDMIVIHGISLPPGEFGSSYIEQFFCGSLPIAMHPYFATIATLKVAPHLFIDRLGVITQFVPFHKRAWHAGLSSFKEKENCNDFSIGIELEGTDDLPYERIQYQVLAPLIALLMRTYPAIISERIVGHSDIAPNRKTDPGPFFDWMHLKDLLSYLSY